MVALTSDTLIPRNLAQLMKEHSKKIEMDKLSSSYNSLVEELKWAKYRNDVKKRESLLTEFANCKAKVKELHDQMKIEIFATVSVIFNPRENVNEEDLMHFRPDLQMIVNAKFYDKVNVWKALSQVLVLSHI